MSGEKGHRVARLALAAGAVAGLLAAWRARPRLVRCAGGPALVYVTRDASGERVRVLRTGGVYQSATYLGARRMEPVFAYYRAFDLLFSVRPDARRLLVVGGGGFAFPKLVAAEHPGVRTDVVELEASVVEAARRWFFLDEAVALARATGGDLRVITADGRAFLERDVAPGTYDAVVLDAFVGAEPVRRLATVEALRLVRRALAPGGACLMNVVSREDGADVSFLRSVLATALVVFSHAAVVPCTDETHAAEDNYLVVASDAPLDLLAAIGYDADFLGDVLLDGDSA